ncbi:MAG: DUF5658 family protein [Nanopusillaceae archaeon]
MILQVVAFLLFYDLLTTAYGMYVLGLQELNPLLANLSIVELIAIKGFLTIVAVAILHTMKTVAKSVTSKTIVYTVMAIIAILYSAIAVNNTIEIVGVLMRG